MRLSHYKSLLESIDFKTVFPKFDGSNRIVGNLDIFRSFITKIADVPGLEAELAAIQGSSIFGTSRDSLNLDQNEYGQLMNLVSRLQTALPSLLKILRTVVAAPDESSILIKLPKEADFKGILQDMTVIQQSLEQVILNDTINGSIVLKSWETGSFWMELYLGVPLAVALVGGLSWSGAVVFKKIQEGRIFVQQARSLSIKNDSLEDIANAQRDALKLLVDSEAKSLYDKFFPSPENSEQLERLKHSIRVFSELIDKGAEIHPSLMQPEVASNVFPDFAKLPTISSQIRQIEDK